MKACPLKSIPLPAPVGTFALDLNDTSMKELWIAVAWVTSADAALVAQVRRLADSENARDRTTAELVLADHIHGHHESERS